MRSRSAFVMTGPVLQEVLLGERRLQFWPAGCRERRALRPVAVDEERALPLGRFGGNVYVAAASRETW
jgi:hypothetical protein